MPVRNADLLAAGVWAATAAAAALTGAPVPLTAVLGIPAVLLVPGYVWADVLIGTRQVSGLLRLAVTGALSLAIVALVPIALGLGGLTLSREVLISVPAVAAVVGTVVADARRDARGEPAAEPRRRRRPPTVAVAAVLVAAALVATAAVITWSSALSTQGSAGTRLWLDPTVTAQGTVTAVVSNDGTSPQRYEVEIRIAGRLWSRATVDLPAGGAWRYGIPRDEGSPLDVVVSDPTTGIVLRHVTAQAPPAPEP